MAEIKIEKKKPIWPWILAALAVLLILFFIFSGGDDDMDELDDTVTDTTEVEETWTNDTLTTNTTSSEVNEYITFIRTDSDERMGLQHNYTETALTRLADAVQAKADQANVDIQQEMDRVDGVADYLNEDTYQTQHADSLRVAFMQINNSLEKISQNNNSTLDLQGLRNNAEAIQPAQKTLNQKDEVRAYFDKAAEVLQEMDRTMAGNQMNQNTTTQTDNY